MKHQSRLVLALLPLLLLIPAACSQRSFTPAAPISPASAWRRPVPPEFFPGPPAHPVGLTQAGEELYATTQSGGSFGRGAIVRVNLSGKARTIYSVWKGAFPEAGALAVDGELYATTWEGGEQRNGTVFAVDAATGVRKFLYEFQGSPNDGSQPQAPLANINGVFYGTTTSGGGTIFKITRSGHETMLYMFQGGLDGSYPDSGLAYHERLLYGATYFGGSSNCGGGCGTVYVFDPATGTEAPIYRFQGGNDGYEPDMDVLFVNGKMYGVTTEGGSYSGGTLYRIDPSTGRETILHNFGANGDGDLATSSVIYVNGVLYGVTFGGGPRGGGTVYSFDLSTKRETVLHSFSGYANPNAPLIRVGSLLYGVTEADGTNERGTIFKIDTSGNESVLYNF